MWTAAQPSRYLLILGPRRRDDSRDTSQRFTAPRPPSTWCRRPLRSCEPGRSRAPYAGSCYTAGRCAPAPRTLWNAPLLGRGPHECFICPGPASAPVSVHQCRPVTGCSEPEPRIRWPLIGSADRGARAASPGPAGLGDGGCCNTTGRGWETEAVSTEPAGLIGTGLLQQDRRDWETGLIRQDQQGWETGAAATQPAELGDGGCSDRTGGAIGTGLLRQDRRGWGRGLLRQNRQGLGDGADPTGLAGLGDGADPTGPAGWETGRRSPTVPRWIGEWTGVIVYLLDSERSELEGISIRGVAWPVVCPAAVTAAWVHCPIPTHAAYSSGYSHSLLSNSITCLPPH